MNLTPRRREILADIDHVFRWPGGQTYWNARHGTSKVTHEAQNLLDAGLIEPNPAKATQDLRGYRLTDAGAALLRGERRD